ncbi:MAG: cyclic nucleotide-binding domain-containing protein [Terracidiphilus sp.]
MKHESFAADQRLIQALERVSLPVSCDDGRTLFNQGENCHGLYILEDGEAVLVLESHTGQAVMCLTVGGGSLMGLPGVIGKEPYSLSAMVRKGSRVGYVTLEAFETLIRAEPSLYPDILKVLAAELRSARRAFAEN